MFEGIANFFKRLMKSESKQAPSKETAKERLHLVLMQDRANVSADFLELMKQEIIEVIKKYIEVEESAIDVRLTKEMKEDGTQGAPSLYANIPILNIKNDMKSEIKKDEKPVGGDAHIDPKNEENEAEEIEPKKEEEKPEENIGDKQVKEVDNKEENEPEKVEENNKSEELEKKDESKEIDKQERKEKKEVEKEDSIKSEKMKENKKAKTTDKKENNN